MTCWTVLLGSVIFSCFCTSAILGSRGASSNIMRLKNTCDQQVNVEQCNDTYQNSVCTIHNESVFEVKEACDKFKAIVRSAMLFACYGNITVGDETINISKNYVQLYHSEVNQTVCPTAESINMVKEITRGTQHFKKILVYQRKIISLNESINKQYKSFTHLNATATFEMCAIMHHENVQLIESMKHEAQLFSDFLAKSQLSNIFQTNLTNQYTCLQNFNSMLFNATEKLEEYTSLLPVLEKFHTMRFIITPILMGAMFLVGILANLPILIVFIRYKDMRRTTNIMLFNLIISDCLSLTFNMLLNIVRRNFEWKLGLACCQLFYVMRFTLTTSTTFSIAMISVQRYFAVMQYKMSDWCKSKIKKKSIVMLSAVWIVSVLVSLPHGAAANVSRGLCHDDEFAFYVLIVATDFFVICVTPTMIVATFTILTFSTVRRSIKLIPGHTVGQQNMKQIRMVSSYVLISLAVLFVVSYLPFYLFCFILHFTGMELDVLTFLIVEDLTYIFQFLNTCLNPVALLLLSKTIRHRAFSCSVNVFQENSQNSASIARYNSQDSRNVTLIKAILKTPQFGRVLRTKDVTTQNTPQSETTFSLKNAYSKVSNTVKS
ncbi:hypothetical protein C0J52_19363 [Blattella germanica]|nr:hypothetical protein C0J52_19363 [Blattella germanica]PSN33815.1 hypothetical protein C0J52_19363 [Blattella germanica]